jgi:hypothetical protein
MLKPRDSNSDTEVLIFDSFSDVLRIHI